MMSYCAVWLFGEEVYVKLLKFLQCGDGDSETESRIVTFDGLKVCSIVF